MFEAKHATLFLLITYHWHASLAVSTWPSGRLGIVAEVNGSPTDARLNIPVVKRSSNQAELANELPPRRSVVVRGDSQEELDEFLGSGYSRPTQGEYENGKLEKSIEPTIGTLEGWLDREDDDKRIVASAKLFDSSRLHQQSRNAKVARNRRRSTRHRSSNALETPGDPSQLRFIPLYDDRSRYLTPFGSRGSKGSIVNEIVVFAKNGELTRRNITDLSSGFDERRIESLSDSLDDVLDGPSSPERTYEFPNVRAILPNRVFILPPRLIYDTKILPSPFSLDEYFANDPNIEPVNDRLSDVNNPGSSVKGVFDSKKTDYNSEKTSTTPSRERGPVTSLENFVTPLPSRAGQVSFGVNQPELVTILPDEKYRVEGLGGKAGNPSRVREFETLKSDGDEPRVNHESPGEMGLEDHGTGIRSSYDNSKSTYAKDDETGMENVDRSAIIKVINDEFANRQTARRGQESKVPSGLRMGSLRLPGGRKDVNYHRDAATKWRGEDKSDRMRYVAKYSFDYLVNDDKSQNDFGHFEMRDEGITKGRYHVKLPDGRTQKVNYHVDDNGYHAVVTYRRDDDR